MTTTRADHDGDPWVARWVNPDGAVHHLYAEHVALLGDVAAGKVQTDSRFPRWVYVGDRRCTVRDQANRAFRHLVDIGAIVAGTPEHRRPPRPDRSGAGQSFTRTRYQLAAGVAAAIRAVVR